MAHHDPLEFPDESTPVSRLRREVETNSGYNEPSAPAGEKLFAADILAVCSDVERLKAENERLRAALKVLEWLPEEDGQWAECPCCGAARRDGHIRDGCQLSLALERKE